VKPQASARGRFANRCNHEGLAGLSDRSSRPHPLHRPTPQAIVEQVEVLRRRTGKQIAAELHLTGDRQPHPQASGTPFALS